MTHHAYYRVFYGWWDQGQWVGALTCDAIQMRSER